MPPSLPPPLIFNAKFKFLLHPILLKIGSKTTVTHPPPPPKKGQSQNYGASVNSNGLLTLSGLLSIKFLLQMTTSFIKSNSNDCKAMHGVQNYISKLKQNRLRREEAKINHKTQFYRIKGGGGVPSPLAPTPIIFARVDEIL